MGNSTAELIARLEAAEVGSRELDWLVASLMGYIPPHRNFNDGPPYSGWRTLRVEKYVLESPRGCEGRTSERWVPNPVTTSIDAALALAVSLFGERNTATMLFIVAGSGDDIKRFPIRLCIAILRALDSQSNTA